MDKQETWTQGFPVPIHGIKTCLAPVTQREWLQRYMQVIDETLRLGGIAIWLLREAKVDIEYQGNCFLLFRCSSQLFQCLLNIQRSYVEFGNSCSEKTNNPRMNRLTQLLLLTIVRSFYSKGILRGSLSLSSSPRWKYISRGFDFSPLEVDGSREQGLWHFCLLFTMVIILHVRLTWM